MLLVTRRGYQDCGPLGERALPKISCAERRYGTDLRSENLLCGAKVRTVRASRTTALAGIAVFCYPPLVRHERYGHLPLLWHD